MTWTVQIDFLSMDIHLLPNSCLELPNIVRQIKFKGAWGKLEAKICLQRQPWTKYLRETLVLK